MYTVRCGDEGMTAAKTAGAATLADDGGRAGRFAQWLQHTLQISRTGVPA